MGESEFRNKVTWYNFILSLLVVLIHAVNLVPSNGILQERIREMAAGGASGVALLPYRIEDFFSNGLAQAAVPGFSSWPAICFTGHFTAFRISEESGRSASGQS